MPERDPGRYQEVVRKMICVSLCSQSLMSLSRFTQKADSSEPACKWVCITSSPGCCNISPVMLLSLAEWYSVTPAGCC